ncbi:hypothetical protein [Bosea sp. (in: a-proteobacteria)]|uniref:hypothetical protein n=1 Tax=Bosea sp. (in: a-proteobacteria) TaxID=1871050 RepID=UPI002736B735|nr:hypothetical protein [Bosea sp. (in: a-proteobacteria)]MDP3258580.1 hypothetical protein [Bosea sp. (in: a-proteobacteria)]
MVPYKRALDELRDRVVARVRPYANWYSWQLDISVAKNNRHPHYHLLCIIPSDLAEAFYDDIGDLRFGVFRGGEGLMDVGHCDWQEGDRRRKPLDLADRQEAWIMALAYVTRVFTERDMPRWTCAPTLSCPLEVEDYRDQIGRAWDQALPRIFEVNSEQKALGARRIALLLKDDTRRRVISFRQSKAWRATPTAQAPVHKAAGATVSPVVSDISHFPLTPIQAAPHETPCGAAYLSLLDELGSSPEHGSLDFAQELERNLEHGGGADDGSFPSRVVKKGIKQQRGGRPRKTFSQQAVLVALCERGSVVAAAKALGTSRRLISEVLQDAGVASPPRGRPRRDRQAVR